MGLPLWTYPSKDAISKQAELLADKERASIRSTIRRQHANRARDDAARQRIYNYVTRESQRTQEAVDQNVVSSQPRTRGVIQAEVNQSSEHSESDSQDSLQQSSHMSLTLIEEGMNQLRNFHSASLLHLQHSQTDDLRYPVPNSSRPGDVIPPRSTAEFRADRRAAYRRDSAARSNRVRAGRLIAAAQVSTESPSTINITSLEPQLTVGDYRPPSGSQFRILGLNPDPDERSPPSRRRRRQFSDGLGDRDRSPSPDADGAWETLLTTITPDPQPPSAASSFVVSSAAAAHVSEEDAPQMPDGEATDMSDEYEIPEFTHGMHFPFTQEMINEYPDCIYGDGGRPETLLSNHTGNSAQVADQGPMTAGMNGDRELDPQALTPTQRILRRLAARQDISDEWWAEIGLSRSSQSMVSERPI